VKTEKQKGKVTMEKAYNDFATFSQENIDAFVRANAAFTRGVEQLSKNFVTLATRSLGEAVEAGKRFAAAKSFGEVVELQSKYAQESIETFLTETKKAQDLSTSIVKEATGPIAERFKATVSNGAAAAQATANAAVNAARASKQAA